MTERTVPDPPTGRKYLAGPMPDPPQRGWWLDPDNATLMRYHDGRSWTDETMSSLDGDAPSWGSLWGAAPGDAKLYFAITVFGIIGVLFLLLASALHHDTAGYDWANRLGLFCILGVFISFVLFVIIVPNTGAKKMSFPSRIVLLIVGAIPLAAVVWLYWGRIQDAFWLR